MIVSYEQREAEVAEQPLRRPFPGRLPVPHADQFADERHIFLSQFQRLANPAPHLDFLGGDVGATRLEAGNLDTDVVEFLADLTPLYQVLGQIVLQLLQVRIQTFPKFRKAPPLLVKLLFVRRHLPIDHADEVGILASLVLALPAQPHRRFDVVREAFDPVPAVLADGASEFLDFGEQILPTALPPLNLGAAPTQFRFKAIDEFVEEADLQPGEIRSESLPIPGHLHQLGFVLGVLVALRDERLEHPDLALGPEHCLVRPTQVVEVSDQRLDPRFRVEGLEHVTPDEIRQVPDGLHRDSLVKEIQGLLVVDSETAAEPSAVGAEGLPEFNTALSKELAELLDVCSEPREVATDGQLLQTGGVESLRLRVGIR